MASAQTTTRARTITVARLAVVSKQFSLFLQKIPEAVMDDERRRLYLSHINRRNISRISLLGLDAEGAAVVMARCSVDWDLYGSNAPLKPNIEVISGKEGLEITVATLDAFDQIVSAYDLGISYRIVLSPCDMSRERLMEVLGLEDAEPVRWRNTPIVSEEDVSEALPEMSVGLVVAEW